MRVIGSSRRPPGVLNILPGPGAALGDRIATHPGIDKISFTGETRTGAKLLKLGADDIKTHPLELAARAPTSFLRTRHREGGEPTRSRPFGMAGELPARTRVFVERSAADSFTAALRRRRGQCASAIHRSRDRNRGRSFPSRNGSP